MKTITVEDKTWEMLTRVKLDYNYKSLDQIIKNLLEIFTADKLKAVEEKEDDNQN